jgi:hypothetical protein
MKLRRLALEEGFKAALRIDGTWVYYESAEEAKEYADYRAVERPLIMDIETMKRVLI